VGDELSNYGMGIFDHHRILGHKPHRDVKSPGVAWSITLDPSLDWLSIPPAHDITIIEQAAKHACGASMLSIPLDAPHFFTPGSGISRHWGRSVNPGSYQNGKSQNPNHKTVAGND